MRIALLLLALESVAGAVAPSVAFGGFSADGGKYLVANDRICTPGVVSAGGPGGNPGKVTREPACEPVADRSALAAFTKPKRAQKLADGRKLDVSLEGNCIVVGAGDDLLFKWDRKKPIKDVSGAFLTDDGGTIAVEFTAPDGSADVVAFLMPGAAAPTPPPTPPAPAMPTSAPAQPAVQPKGDAFDKAMADGGVWEQGLVPCDTAGVTLTLAKDLTFALRVQTRCQGQKHISDFKGKWTPVGKDQVVLTMPNQDAQDDQFACTIESCEDDANDRCLSCLQGDDVAFTMKVVKR